jgi:hypothetical protein
MMKFLYSMRRVKDSSGLLDGILFRPIYCIYYSIKKEEMATYYCCLGKKGRRLLLFFFVISSLLLADPAAALPRLEQLTGTNFEARHRTKLETLNKLQAKDDEYPSFVVIARLLRAVPAAALSQLEQLTGHFKAIHQSKLESLKELQAKYDLYPSYTSLAENNYHASLNMVFLNNFLFFGWSSALPHIFGDVSVHDWSVFVKGLCWAVLSHLHPLFLVSTSIVAVKQFRLGFGDNVFGGVGRTLPLLLLLFSFLIDTWSLLEAPDRTPKDPEQKRCYVFTQALFYSTISGVLCAQTCFLDYAHILLRDVE